MLAYLKENAGMKLLFAEKDNNQKRKKEGEEVLTEPKLKFVYYFLQEFVLNAGCWDQVIDLVPKLQEAVNILGTDYLVIEPDISIYFHLFSLLLCGCRSLGGDSLGL